MPTSSASRPVLRRFVFGACVRVSIVWLVLALPAVALAASSQPEPPPAQPTQAQADALRKLLPASALLATRADGRLYWQIGGAETDTAYAVHSVDADGTPRIVTPLGHLAVDRRVIAEPEPEALRVMPDLIAHALAAQLEDGDLRVQRGLLTGAHLSGKHVRVIAEGVLRQVMSERREDELPALRSAIDQAGPALADSGLAPLGQRAVADLLARCLERDAAVPREIDDLLPSVARRFVRHGYLRGLLSASAASTIERSVLNAEALRPVSRFAGSDAAGRTLHLAELKDAFGSGGWVLTTPQRSAYLRPHPKPSFYTNAKGETILPDLLVVVDVPAGSDPAAPATGPIAARAYLAGRVLANWNLASGLNTDDVTWRREIPKRRPEDAVHNMLPPHLAIARLDGDIIGLAVPGGLLVPPADSSAGEADRFLADAARLLPDAGYLDLLGEYCFAYVYDSPDPRFPKVVGNRAEKGDIHQTARATIATVAGGILRGDCDDLAELYENLADRQGRTAHVIDLPAHAAAAWAERREDGHWHVSVLQTGPAVSFSDPQLTRALTKAYTSFGRNEAFDPDQLGLLLRFSGENTRAAFRLSWRIFSDPDYARAMIDVQRDWHFHTYQRGISTMQRMLAAGDEDTANHRELAGLYGMTGQYQRAAEHQRIARERSSGDLGKMLASIELLAMQLKTSELDQARALARELIAERIPRLRRELGPALAQVGTQLVSILVEARETELALAAIDQVLSLPMPLLGATPQTLPEQIAELADRLAAVPPESPEAKRWRDDLDARAALGGYAATVDAVLGLAGPDRFARQPNLRAAARAAERWLADLSFRGLEERSGPLFSYAAAAAHYAGALGTGALGQDRLTAMLDQVEAPVRDADHTVRDGGLVQLAQDLPWIRISVPYWSMRLGEQLTRHQSATSNATAAALWRSSVAELASRVAAAHAACRKIGLEDPRFDYDAHLAGLTAALVLEQPQALAERLRAVRVQGDKRLRDASAERIGAIARHLSLAWFGQVMDIWQQEEDASFKPVWLAIAWTAAAVGGEPTRAHALLVAERAKRRFGKEDPAFVEEEAFMRRLFTEAK